MVDFLMAGPEMDQGIAEAVRRYATARGMSEQAAARELLKVGLAEVADTKRKGKRPAKSWSGGREGQHRHARGKARAS